MIRQAAEPRGGDRVDSGAAAESLLLIRNNRDRFEPTLSPPTGRQRKIRQDGKPQAGLRVRRRKTSSHAPRSHRHNLQQKAGIDDEQKTATLGVDRDRMPDRLNLGGARREG
jgi:hypothetical protein